MTQPHKYTSSYPPSLKIDEGIKTFFKDFYRISDTGTEEAHEAYADCFTESAELVMPPRRCRGRSEIIQIRKSLWEKVSSRLHSPTKIFPFGENSNEVMIFGTVAYVLKDGRRAEVEWAARAEMVKEGEKWKMGFYQVYLDTGAIQNAK